MGTRTTPISRNDVTAAPGGTNIELVFDKRVPPLDAADLKKILATVLDFEQRTATEQAIDTMPPEIAQAVRDKRVVEGMDRDQVILAMGKPRHKVRETKEGLDTEDWIYGLPPGKVTFVTFANGKVTQVKEAYAGLGGSTVPTMKPPL
jgi:hypothetical protein